MRVDLARHIIEGTLKMEVASARHTFEPAGDPSSADIEAAIQTLDAHVAQTMGNGRSLADAGLTLGHLPMLLEGAGVITRQRRLELTRRDMTQFLPSDLAYGYTELGTSTP